MRYYVRGIDEDGNTANFVETEQLVLYGGMVGSFIQVSPPIVAHLLIDHCHTNRHVDQYHYTGHRNPTSSTSPFL